MTSHCSRFRPRLWHRCFDIVSLPQSSVGHRRGWTGHHDPWPITLDPTRHIRVPPRFFSHVVVAVDKSETQRFREIPLSNTIVQYVESVGVGIPPRRTARMNNTRPILRGRGPRSHQRRPNQGRDGDGVESARRRPTLIPIPFDPKLSRPVRVLGVSSVRLSSDGDPTTMRPLGAGPDNDENRPTLTFDFPKNKLHIPEVAVIGRSNVGKSTLLNLLLYRNWSRTRRARNNSGHDDDRAGSRRGRQKSVASLPLPKGVKATTSPRPGETKALTFYLLAERRLARETRPTPALDNDATTTRPSTTKVAHPEEVAPTTSAERDPLAAFTSRRLVLVDLPGYGFAYVSENAHLRDQIVSYLLDRGPSILKRVLLLVDARHGIKKADSDFLRELQDELYQRQQQTLPTISNQKNIQLPPIQLVLTKCDLVTQDDLVRRIVQVRRQLADCLDRESGGQLPVMLVSARVLAGNRGRNGTLPPNGVDANEGGDGIPELQRQLAALTVSSKSKDARVIAPSAPTTTRNGGQVKRSVRSNDVRIIAPSAPNRTRNRGQVKRSVRSNDVRVVAPSAPTTTRNGGQVKRSYRSNDVRVIAPSAPKTTRNGVQAKRSYRSKDVRVIAPSASKTTRNGGPVERSFRSNKFR